MAFDLLSQPIRKYIREKRWEQLRPIQAAAITRILSSDENFILASRTASGKTEAAFLPILSKVNFNEPGVQVLYISPLIALINDQFYRIEELCKYLDVSVTKWHGEASKSQKNQVIKNPSGIVLITPESLEAMFVNKPFNVKHLFQNLKFIVVDEIHSFIGTDRGIQLKSILSRIQNIAHKPFSVIGLSATLGDFNEAKRFTGNESNTKVLLDKTAKEITVNFKFFKTDREQLPQDFYIDLYYETKEQKVLIFPNSRGRTEEIAVNLKRVAARLNGHKNYFSHHASVDREVREYIEFFAKNTKRENFCICCTSTLELGIDIGSIDEVIQIDSTYSIASLIQRVGRSGRRDDSASSLYIYATNKWSLLQSLACWQLFKSGFIEPPEVTSKPYDLFLHQLLSVIKGNSGKTVSSVMHDMRKNFAFHETSESEMQEIIDHLLLSGIIEKINNEIIIGIDGEVIVNNKDFYSVFKSEENFKVVNAGNVIGEVPFSPQISEDENILLAAQVWKIMFVDPKAKKVEVVRASDGKKPIFYGAGGIVHPKVREQMLEILSSDNQFEILNEEAQEELNILRNEFKVFNLRSNSKGRPLLVKDMELAIFTFTGTRINRTLNFLFNLSDIKTVFDDSSSCFEIKMEVSEFLSKWNALSDKFDNIDFHIEKFIETYPNIIDFSKWGTYLPVKYQVSLLKQKYFDFVSAKAFIEGIVFNSNTEQKRSVQ